LSSGRRERWVRSRWSCERHLSGFRTSLHEAFLMSDARAPFADAHLSLESAAMAETLGSTREIPDARSSEPIHVSARFRLTLESAIAALEAGAACDEQMLPRLTDMDHRRRQRLLVGVQQLRAQQLRELLARTVLRTG